MSAPTREEMLEWLNNEITKYAFLSITHPHLWQAPTNRDCKIYRATRRLIENSPRVTREFVIRKANEYNLPHFWLFQFVRELGCKVENEEK